MDTRLDARLARALQTRIDLIDEEMHACERHRQEAYEIADALLDEQDELAEQRFRLSMALWKIQNRLSRAAFQQNIKSSFGDSIGHHTHSPEEAVA